MARVILLTDFSEVYARQLLRGIVQYSKEHEPWVLCKMPHPYRERNGLEGVLAWALKWKADAIIAQFRPGDEVEMFSRHGIIPVAQDFISRFHGIPNITGAHRQAGKMGAAYFIRKGFRHFAFYGIKDVVWSEERCEGFREELKRKRLDESFYAYSYVDPGDLWFYESDVLIEWLKTLPKPVAIMACDDNQGHHIIEACKQSGIQVPEQIAVLGVDNDESVCTLSDPPLSSLCQAVEKGGYDTAALIDRLIRRKGKTEPGDITVLPTHIVTRRSSDIYATDDRYMATVLTYIHQHSDRRVPVEELVALVPLSRRLLELRFKETTGLPVYTYALHLRMEKFAQQLIGSKAPIVEIAARMGLTDYKNVARQFRQIKGCSPSEYRVKHSL